MDVQALHQFVASRPGTFGQRAALCTGVSRLAAGNPDYAAALVDLAGLGVIPALVRAGAPPAALRIAIETALLERYRELRTVDRPTFASWCRAAAFTPPAGTPETVDLYRGTMGCSPAAAATGLHWTLSFDKAALYGARFADADLTGVIVLHARVPREGIAAFVSGVSHSEVVPAEVPGVFEVVTDKARIGEGAVRFGEYQGALLAQGWSIGSLGPDAFTREDAVATRARMAAAGVPRGAAIVA